MSDFREAAMAVALTILLLRQKEQIMRFTKEEVDAALRQQEDKDVCLRKVDGGAFDVWLANGKQN